MKYSPPLPIQFWNMFVEYIVNIFTFGAKWRKMCNDVKEVGEKWQALPPKYVVVSPQNEDGEMYLREMAGIFNNQQFSWFLYKVREMAVMNLANKPIEGAQVNVGIITGVDIIAAELRKINAKWDALEK